MSIKTTLRVCLIAVRMDIIKKTKTTNIGEDVKKKGSLFTVRMEVSVKVLQKRSIF
jgi:hypothetical protein